MAEILIIPTKIKLSLTITSDERDILLAALDFARTYLTSKDLSLGPTYPQSRSWYQQRIDPIEQLLAGTL